MGGSRARSTCDGIEARSTFIRFEKLLELCVDSASLLRVPLSHSLEMTVFADTFDVLEYDFS